MDVVVVVAVALGFQLVELAAAAHVGADLPPALAQLLNSYRNADVQAKLLAYLLNLVVSLGVVGWFLVRYKVGVAAVGWRRTDAARSVLYVVGTLLVLRLVTSGLFAVAKQLPGFDPGQAQQNYYIQIAANHRLVAFAALVVLPPILEETVFRGFVFPALAKRWGMVQGALVSSIIFGLAHAQANLDLYTYVMALALCFMYVRLRSIFPGMALHMVNNYLAYVTLFHK